MADKRAKRIAELIKPLRVKPGSKVDLAKDFDPGYKAGFLKKKDGRQLLRTGIALLADYQARLAAQDTYGVLMCLQALDAGGGKDGTIRHVMSGVNPQGVHVSGFKVPSAEELDHDYLWRYAWRLPARGDIGIFNRSHYEEVLVVRVHAENLDRQKLPEEEDDYQKAFSEMLSATSTPWAPWYVIPADRKWFARICTAAVLAHTLIEIDPQYPEVTADRRQQLLVVKSELETQAPKGTPSDPFAAKQAKAEAKQAKAEARGEAKEEAKAGASQVGGDARQAQKARSHDQPAQAAPRASRARPKGQPG